MRRRSGQHNAAVHEIPIKQRVLSSNEDRVSQDRKTIADIKNVEWDPSKKILNA